VPLGATSGGQNPPQGTETKVLTCQSNRFVDNSSNAFAISLGGTPSIQPFSPFNPTTAYSTSSVGGSGYFDGSGDYLSVPSNAAFAYGTGAVTIEAFINTTTKVDFQSIIGSFDSAGWFLHTAATGVALAGLNSSTFITGTINVCDGAWHHIAMVRSGSTLTLYIDGVANGAISDSTNVSSTTEVRIGGLSAGLPRPFTGFIGSLRVVKGTAVYTTAFTPPTAPLTAITNTSLLTNFTNAGIFDNAAVADYETVGNAQISTSVKKYGTGSMAFDGTGDYLTFPANYNLQFGTGDFTIEFWTYLNSVSGNQMFIDNRNSTGSGAAYITLYSSGTSLIFYTTGNDRITATSALSTSVWLHVALCRVAGQTRLFINGTQVGTTYADTNSYLAASTTQYIGSRISLGDFNLNGYIDDFRISKGVGRYPYNFTPPTAEFPNIGGTVTLTADPYFDYTTLLLPGNGTNGAQNNTFLDSSTNNFTITRNGNTTQGTFSPFSQTGWGNYFDGTGDYLSIASNAAFSVGTGDFTQESWIYPLNWTGSISTIFVVSSTGGLWIGKNASNFVVRAFGVADQLQTTQFPAVNQWTHVAVVRSGTTLSLYYNGSRIATTTNSYNFAQGILAIGDDGGASGPFAGYISNSRLVKGTAIYDPTASYFTPPTAPLTAVSGTSILTCQSNRFVDNSSNAFAITRNGDVSVQAFSPFNPTAAWSAATYGGSGYFDGSGDYLQAGTNANLALGSGDFTIDGWHYCTGYNGGASLYSTINTYPSSTGLLFYIDSIGRYTIDVNGTILQPAGTAVLNTWVHWAVVRNGSTLSIYINGTSIGSVSSSTNFTDQYAVVGRTGAGTNSNLWLGYLSGVRMVKGTAVYTGSFTPPTAPPTAISNTQFLLNYTNAGIYDATSKNDLETVGNAQISTTQSKFGGSSMYFDGTGDYLLSQSNVDLQMGTGDFTVEAWVYITVAPSSGTRSRVYSFQNHSASQVVLALAVINTSGTLYGDAILRSADGTGITVYTGATPIPLNTWTHLALTRSGTTGRLFVNGLLQDTETSQSQNLSQTLPAAIAAAANNTEFVNGYIQDLRITKGIARYTSNFTPPTTAFLTL
jgi:hypothetical protein